MVTPKNGSGMMDAFTLLLPLALAASVLLSCSQWADWWLLAPDTRHQTVGLGSQCHFKSSYLKIPSRIKLTLEFTKFVSFFFGGFDLKGARTSIAERCVSFTHQPGLVLQFLARAVHGPYGKAHLLVGGVWNIFLAGITCMPTVNSKVMSWYLTAEFLRKVIVDMFGKTLVNVWCKHDLWF